MQPLQKLEKSDDSVPIILLDFSASVLGPFCEDTRVLEHLIYLIKQVALHDGFSKAALIMFSNEAQYMGMVEIADLDFRKLITSAKIDPQGTNMDTALKMINRIRRTIRRLKKALDSISGSYSDTDDTDDSKIEELPTPDDDKKTPIYIFSDGEVDDTEQDLSVAINDTFGIGRWKIKQNLDLRMIILESNNKNYFTEDCTAGNVIIKTLKDSNMSNVVKYIFFFNQHHRMFEDRFVNIYNASLPNDYVQYDDRCFHIKYYPVFLANITQEIMDLRNQIILDDIEDIKREIELRIQQEAEEEIEDNEDEENDEIRPLKIPRDAALDDIINNRSNTLNTEIMGRLEKIGYNLIKTIRDLEKASVTNKKFNKKQTIDFFCNMIGIDQITDYMRRELIYNLDDKTYQENKRNSNKKFDSKKQFGMYTDLKKCLDPYSNTTYTSFLENDCIYDIVATDVEYSINLGFREYKHAAVYDIKNKRLVPILPMIKYIPIDTEQMIRRWIRAIYSKKYGIPANSDLIHYMFLLDNLYIQCSSKLPDHIKEAYNIYALTMLSRVRYNESLNEKNYLIKGNPPKPIGSNQEFREFLSSCPNYVRMINSNGEIFDPMTIWFMMIAVIELGKRHSDELLEGQSKYCTDLVMDGVLPVPYTDFVKQCEKDNKWTSPVFIHTHKRVKVETPREQILRRVKWTVGLFKNTDYSCIQLKIDPAQVQPNYYCYITLSDTSDTGGYMFYPHSKDGTKNLCRPDYVISDEAHNAYTTSGTVTHNGLHCPNCNIKIVPQKMKKIEPQDEYEQRDDVVHTAQEKKKMYCKVEIYDDFSNDLISLNELTFENNYRHKVFFREHLILANPIDSYNVMHFGTSDKQSEFNAKVPKFLFELDWTNIVVAGGMCRSILLGQKIQDIDIFFVGLDESHIKLRMIDLINDIVLVLQKENPEYRFILMYKPLNSVVELLCTKSTFDENNTEFDDDDITIDEKFLFIHNEIIHKIQIILKPHESINDIFDNFDMYPSCVAFDGTLTYFTEASYVAYRYMINMIDREKASHESYDHRILKYYKYGFSLALDRKQIDESLLSQILKSPKIVKISGCVFELLYTNTDDRYIMLNSFRLARKQRNITTSTSTSTSTPDTAVTVKKDKALYEGFDTVLDTSMINLYNYMMRENIRYCYIMGPAHEEEFEDVLNIDQIEFLKDKRTGEFNWYDASGIMIAS